MQSNNKKKICLVVSSLGRGGAERSSALLSIMFDQMGYDVHIISILNYIDYEYRGTLLNLGLLKEASDSLIDRVKRFFIFRSYIKSHQFDFIIDNRTRTPNLRELLISLGIYKGVKTIFMVRSYRISRYFPKSKILTKFLYSSAFKIVGVSKEIANTIKETYHFQQVTSIYNPIQIFPDREENIQFEYILAYGRLDDAVKNYSMLIEAYAMSALPEHAIKLFILGEGKDEAKLKKAAAAYDLVNSVVFQPFEKNPSGYITKAKCVCLTSRIEGFPRVLVEALSLGTPVVSVNCKSGPKELVVNGENGLLVEKYTAKAFADALNSLIFEKKLYQVCKGNAKSSVAHLTLESISTKWKQLLNQP